MKKTLALATVFAFVLSICATAFAQNSNSSTTMGSDNSSMMSSHHGSKHRRHRRHHRMHHKMKSAMKSGNGNM